MKAANTYAASLGCSEASTLRVGACFWPGDGGNEAVGEGEGLLRRRPGSIYMCVCPIASWQAQKQKADGDLVPLPPPPEPPGWIHARRWEHLAGKAAAERAEERGLLFLSGCSP